MKQVMAVLMALCFFLFALSDGDAGILGDVDNDGRIGLIEAVNALQAAAGIRSAQSASYVIVWKGTWAANQDYQVYDAVQINGSSYICKEAHRSDISSQPSSAPSAKWDPVALKGADGAQGIAGPRGEKGDTGQTGSPGLAGVTPDLSLILARITQLERFLLPFAFVSNSESNSITPINLISHTAGSEIPVGTYPNGISRQPGGTQVWVANTNAQSLSVIDTLSNTVVKTIPRDLGASFGSLNRPQSVLFNPSGSSIYVGGDDFLSMFNAASMAPVVSRPFPGTVTNLSMSDAAVLFGIVDGHLFSIPPDSAFWDPDLSKPFDPRVSIVSAIDAEAIMAVATAGVYIANRDELMFYKDSSTTRDQGLMLQYRVRLNTHGKAKGIAVNPATETAYVLSEEGIISVVNTKDVVHISIPALIKNIDMRRIIGEPVREAMALYIRSAAGRDLLYVVLGERSSVVVLDPLAETLIAEIRVGMSPLGIGGP
jgi:YVTN family beta-propeller protein